MRPSRPATPARASSRRPADQTATSADATPRPDGSSPASFAPQGGRPPRPDSPTAARPATRPAVRQGSAAVPLDAVSRAPRRSAPAGPGRTRPTTAGGPALSDGPGRPGVGGTAVAPDRPGRRRKGPVIAGVTVLVLVLLIAWPIGLLIWANGKIQHVSALSGAANTPGTTYLLTGSDSRADGVIEDTETAGARTDTILLLHVPESGPTALISLPRDTYTDIPGYKANKINAAFSWGGAPLLVQTIEGLTGLTVDHYVEIGFGGIEGVVDAVGGVNLCLDDSTGITFPVNEPLSGLAWDAPGCHDVDGEMALAFARMRYADPSGDIGRGLRQRQLISAITSTAATPALLFQPGQQMALIDAGTAALAASDETDIVDLGRLALAFRAATGPAGITGTPPISSLNYRPGGVGSTVRLDPDQAPTFFAAIRDGSLPPGTVGGLPTG